MENRSRIESRALRPDDDRALFRSGDEDLDRFFHRYAGQNQLRHYLGVTYVAVDGSRVVGFARLAVDETTRAMGLGAKLLRFVLDLAARMAGELGCAGLLVDAKPDAVGFYAKYGFVPFVPLEGQSESRPRPTLMGLPIQAIKDARRHAQERA